MAKQTNEDGTRRDAGAPETLTVRDDRTGRSFAAPLQYGTYRDQGAAVAATQLRSLKLDDEDFGVLTYDPGYLATAVCKSSVTFIDGDRGVLHYRGYPIEELAAHSSFLEVAYLLLNGELPTADELAAWTDLVTHHTIIHENIKKFMEGFRYDAHPMGMLVSTVAAMSTFYPEARNVRDAEVRDRQIVRLVAKMPTIAAFAYRHSIGMPYAYPDNDLSYAGNFLNMMFKMTEPTYRPNPVLERALDVLFILHADHEQNCSAAVMRSVGSSLADPYLGVASATAALSGPLHGGANEEVLRMLQTIGSADKVPEYVKRVKAGEFRLMGFGHRVYKNFDPRATIIKGIAEDVLAQTRRTPLLDVAVELERVALADPYFVDRKLYPNVDFYSGLIYEAIGVPSPMFSVLFAIARTVGWLAQWQEMLEDPDLKIVRPRQIYTGSAQRAYTPIDARG
jgi:citrate synthase